MEINELYLYGFFLSFIVTVIITPFTIRLAYIIGAVDKPNDRKVHSTIKPRIGGVAIFLGSVSGFAYVLSEAHISSLKYIIFGALIIFCLGFLDDKYNLSAKTKLAVQFLSALLPVLGGVRIDLINFPLFGRLELGIFSFLITIIWIIAITNAINLIDGLDGLAAGVSTIALSTLAVMSALNGYRFILLLSIILIASTLGFLIFNFHPAKIFMGDSGALYLGYCISIISILGLLKSVTFFSLVIPIIILAVPIFDAVFAIIRRLLNKQDITQPDKSHLHHRFMAIGFSHRSTVLIIYLIGFFFGISAIFFSSTTLIGAFFILAALLVIIQLLAEYIGLLGDHRRPVINFIIKHFPKRKSVGNN